MDRSRWAGKRVLVTGAGSGIGRETAYAFARLGADLILCDVVPEGLRETAERIRAIGRHVIEEQVDVADRDAVRAFAERVHAEIEAVDILVNNAGVGLGGGFLDTSLEDWDWVLGINLQGVLYGCHFFVPPMVDRGRGGHVVNVSSVAGFMATEALCAYSTTKFGVFGLSEALRQELHRHRIGVTAVCPGIINTPITQSSRLRGRAAEEEVRRRMMDFYQRRNYGPERVAAAIVKAVERNRAVAPVSPEAWVFYYLKRWAPSLLAWLTRSMNERMSAAGQS